MTASQKTLRWAELLLLFVGGPVLLWLVPGILAGGRLFPFLWLVASVAELGRYQLRERDAPPLWNAQPLAAAMGGITLRWALMTGALITAFGLVAGRRLPGLAIDVPTGLFGLFYAEGIPAFLPLLIALFYPWVSVYPQNLIFRSFFCQRYRCLLGGQAGLITVNALAFSVSHIMFNNWVVLVLTFVGGLLFTRTYLKHGSLLLAVIEHALYGITCFYIGIGVFLLYGASG